MQGKTMVVIKSLAYILFICLICQLYSCSEKRNGSGLSATRSAIEKTAFSCPPGYEEVIERWGLSGYSRYCQKDGLQHGKWIAFEDERLVIEGGYNLGNKNGRWIWYHEDGRIFRIAEYNDGSEISDKIINK